MPFITKTEFERYASQQMVGVLEADPESFNQAEFGASQTVTRITGVTPPVDVVDSPAWSKQPMHWLVMDIMIDSLPNVNENHIQRARDNRRKAIEELEGWKRGDAPPTIGAAETGKVVSELW
jgi:hypothetical protein